MAISQSSRYSLQCCLQLCVNWNSNLQGSAGTTSYKRAARATLPLLIIIAIFLTYIIMSTTKPAKQLPIERKKILYHFISSQ